MTEVVTPDLIIAVSGLCGSKSDARYNCGQGYPCPSHSLLPFAPNIVPARELHSGVAALVPFVGVLARSYPVRTVIQFSFEVAFSSFRANRKSRFTQPLAERIEIPFQSKKSCKSALLQSRSLFVRRTVNRLKTGGRRRHLVAAEALAAT